jgi:L-ribulose-5-phosphate 4-epimerase
MGETGVVKYNCTWINADPPDKEWLKDLIVWRDKFYTIGLIGEKNGIGYGNISKRYKQNQFFITGSATGKIRILTNRHFTKVTDYDLDKNSLTVVGPVIASSESLTHAAIYQSDKNIHAVIHIHHLQLWEKLLNLIPSTKGEIEYGTPEMAVEIIRLFKNTDIKKKKILVMAGHKEGIVSFGRDIEEAGMVLMEYYSGLSV